MKMCVRIVACFGLLIGSVYVCAVDTAPSEFHDKAVARICDDSVPLKKKLALLEFFQRTGEHFTNKDAEALLQYFKAQPKVCSEALVDDILAGLERSNVLSLERLKKIREIVEAPVKNPDFQALLYDFLAKRSMFGYDGGRTLARLCFKDPRRIVPFLRYAYCHFPEFDDLGSLVEFNSFVDLLYKTVDNEIVDAKFYYLRMACFDDEFSPYMVLGDNRMRALLGPIFKELGGNPQWRWAKDATRLLGVATLNDFKTASDAVKWWTANGNSFSLPRVLVRGVSQGASPERYERLENCLFSIAEVAGSERPAFLLDGKELENLMRLLRIESDASDQSIDMALEILALAMSGEQFKSFVSEGFDKLSVRSRIVALRYMEEPSLLAMLDSPKYAFTLRCAAFCALSVSPTDILVNLEAGGNVKMDFSKGDKNRLRKYAGKKTTALKMLNFWTANRDKLSKRQREKCILALLRMIGCWKECLPEGTTVVKGDDVAKAIAVAMGFPLAKWRKLIACSTRLK